MEIYNGDYCVYIHTNKINGKMYVGITKRNVEQRWHNGYGYTACPRFDRAIKKYGWKNFEHEIFADCLTQEEAYNMEKLLIVELNLQNPEKGYNIAPGGQGGDMNEETKQKISMSNKGKPKPQSWVEKRIGLKAGEKHPLYGTKASAETKAKMSKSHKKYYETHEWLLEPKRKPVIQIETNTVFDSIEAAAQALNICRSSISECCAGKRKSAGGFTWMFAS